MTNLYGSQTHYLFFISIWMTEFLQQVYCDVICDSGFGPIRYCYGLTAYCCGEHHDKCCWEKIYKLWWFWVVAFVVISGIFACCGYYCTNNRHDYEPEDSSFSWFRRFRRTSSTPYMRHAEAEDEWKPYQQRVSLPPYTPSDTVEATSSSIDPNPPQNLPYLEPPPPYSVSVTRPQPAARETQSLLPSAPADAAASSSQTYQQPAAVASSSESYQQPAASSSQTYQQPAASSSQTYQQTTTR